MLIRELNLYTSLEVARKLRRTSGWIDRTHRLDAVSCPFFSRDDLYARTCALIRATGAEGTPPATKTFAIVDDTIAVGSTWACVPIGTIQLRRDAAIAYFDAGRLQPTRGRPLKILLYTVKVVLSLFTHVRGASDVVGVPAGVPVGVGIIADDDVGVVDGTAVADGVGVEEGAFTQSGAGQIVHENPLQVDGPKQYRPLHS